MGLLYLRKRKVLVLGKMSVSCDRKVIIQVCHCLIYEIYVFNLKNVFGYLFTGEKRVQEAGVQIHMATYMYA